MIPECLRSISPKWYEILSRFSANDIAYDSFNRNDISEHERRDNPVLFDERLDIDNFSCCIVGEAWNYKHISSYKHDGDDNGCRACEFYSMEFPSCIENLSEVEGDGEDLSSAYYKQRLEDTIEKFCDHIREQHIELIKDDHD